MNRAFVVATLVVFCVAGASAQFGLGNLFGGSPQVASGAGRSVLQTVCADQNTQTFCKLIQAAGNDPLVRDLSDPTFVGTVFVPLDEDIKDDNGKVRRRLGGDIASLRGNAAARLVAANVITGQALQFDELSNANRKPINSLREEIDIDKGLLGGAGSLLGGLYLKGPENTIRLRSSDGYNNIIAGRAYLHKATGILIPKK